jgi:hypothetical protein
MWSDVTNLYPTHIAPSAAPVGQVLVTEPQVIREQDYMRVQPPSKPYQPMSYSTMHWVARC